MSEPVTPEEAIALHSWYRSFGDPNGAEYLTLDEINAGFALVDGLKANVKPEETMTELARFFGLHPPSLIEYAEVVGVQFVRDHHGPAAAWCDGVACGMAILLMAINMRDQAEGLVA